MVRPRVAATAAGQVLTVDQLARWIAAVKRAHPRSTHFEAIAGVYVDDMLFGAAVAADRNLEDSVVVLAVRWPTVAELRWTRFRDLLASAHPLTSAQVDSAYQAGRVRLMQHLLLRVPADAPPAAVAKILARAQALRHAIFARHGANFAALARRFSEDPGSQASGGYLSVGNREEFLSPFDTVAWSLAPGEVSEVVRSPFGFHVIRRPPLAEVRATYTAGLARLVAAHEDSTHLTLMVAQRHVATEPDAPALVRGMFGNLFAARADRRWLVHYDGGGLRVQDVARWALALNPRQVALLPTASDPQVRQFLGAVTDRVLLLAEADSAGVQLSPQEWQTVRADHDSSLAVLERALGVAAGDFGQAPPDARPALAAAHVAAYLDRMFSGAVQFVGVPPFLASILRDSATWSISRRGVAAAAERADELSRRPPTPGSARPDSSSHRSVP